ncbi:unnamed protein product [Paramecium sonneborni]|uniref:Uncharacterized protein n=1 Tax=Paramecium sonneborni TaxID=65129 RepID=A0A8S1LG74_9CILI|nr:unnamed protein product [Paramecium sonneborni]
MVLRFDAWKRRIIFSRWKNIIQRIILKWEISQLWTFDQSQSKYHTKLQFQRFEKYWQLLVQI